jgi:mannose-6-phosphate isomerase-like protein (cupin superfamily)
MDHAAGNVIEISLNVKHYIMNIIKKTLVFVEVPLKPYFGEDDIVRIEDDYNRK